MSVELRGDVAVYRLPYIAGQSPCDLRNEAIRSSPAPWVFLVDSDVQPAPDCLSLLRAAAEAAPGAALASPRLVNACGGIEYDAAGVHFLGELCFDNAGVARHAARTPKRSPGAASSAALLVRRDAALACGLFDEALEFSREDLDFTLRLTAMGEKLLHVPEAEAEHRPPTPRPTGDLHHRKFYFQARNRWRVLLKLAGWRLLLLTAPLQIVYEALTFFRALATGRASLHAAALRDVASELGPLLRARRRTQTLKRRPDAELFGAPPLSWSPEARSLPGAGAAARLLDTVSRAWWMAIRRFV